jgi:hypothetical protein
MKFLHLANRLVVLLCPVTFEVFFVNPGAICTAHSLSIRLPTTNKLIENNISNITVINAGLVKHLKDINPSKTSGPDEIPNRILKECAVQIAPGLEKNISKSLDTEELMMCSSFINICSLQDTRTHHMQTSTKSPRSPFSQLCIGPLTPYWFNLCSNLPCDTVSNALEKSGMATSTCFPLS